jgi:hypothetical protein
MITTNSNVWAADNACECRAASVAIDVQPETTTQFAGSHVCLNDVAPAKTKPDEKFMRLQPSSKRLDRPVSSVTQNACLCTSLP